MASRSDILGISATAMWHGNTTVLWVPKSQVLPLSLQFIAYIHGKCSPDKEEMPMRELLILTLFFALFV